MHIPLRAFGLCLVGEKDSVTILYTYLKMYYYREHIEIESVSIV